MKTFENKVAVITGAASGIGLAIARQACAEGMNVVLADINEEALSKASTSLRDTGSKVLSVVTDVGDPESIDALSRKCYETFDEVNLLCNNAGVGTGSDLFDPVWMVPPVDWEHIIRVNMWGVIYGCMSFIPKMLSQGTEGHIVNTVSRAGFVRGIGLPVYSMTKHAIVSLSESISDQLADIGSQIKVSVLCPGGGVATSIVVSALKNWTPRDEKQQENAEGLKERFAAARDPVEMAKAMFQALRSDRFYIFVGTLTQEGVQTRFEQIMGAFADQSPV